MSSKQRREKSYSIHGMRSILSAFISRHRFVIKPYHSHMTNRASTGYLFRYLKQFGYVKKKNAQWKIRRHKSISLFQMNHVRLQSMVSPITSLKAHSTSKFPQRTQYKQFPQKKKKKDKGERQNEKKTRKRRRGKKMGTEERERKKKK